MYEIDGNEFDLSHLQKNELPKIRIKRIMRVGNDIIGNVEIEGYSLFNIVSNGYSSTIQDAKLPLPPELYLNIIDMMMKFYYAGSIKSTEIDFDPQTNRSSIKNKEGEKKYANDRVDRGKREQTEETLGYFFSTA